MTLDPAKLTRVTDTSPTGSLSQVTKDDLSGQVVVYSVNRYQPDAVGKYGTGPQLDADLLIVTGPKAGHRDPDWRCWSGLARQMRERCPDGATAVGRVVTGTSDRGTWWGIDPVGDEEVQAANRAIHQALAQAPQDDRDDDVPF